MSTTQAPPLKPPFPWFGGKSKAASIAWSALGNVSTYIEPFAGSLAVLLNRPVEHGTAKSKLELLNDKDCYLANFWRAVQQDPEGVAAWADHPQNEADLHARHQWLSNQECFREKMASDPDFYDCKIAGWWVWGINIYLGAEWPVLGRATVPRSKPIIRRTGVHRKLSHLSTSKKDYQDDLPEYFEAIAARLRYSMVYCGDWNRTVTPCILNDSVPTGIFLDPPYSKKLRNATLYSVDKDISESVRHWAIAHGDNPNLRIILCGMEGEHPMPTSWRTVSWVGKKGRGGASNLNRHQEMLWLSPHCL